MFSPTDDRPARLRAFLEDQAAALARAKDIITTPIADDAVVDVAIAFDLRCDHVRSISLSLSTEKSQ